MSEASPRLGTGDADDIVAAWRPDRHDARGCGDYTGEECPRCDRVRIMKVDVGPEAMIREFKYHAEKAIAAATGEGQ